MDDDRRSWLWSVVLDHAQGESVTIEDVCAAIISQTGVDAVAVTLVLTTGSRDTLYASDGVASAVAELAVTLGEGPSLDAAAGRPVLVADLATAGSATEWPVFAPGAVASGARAAFALPIQVGGIRLGVVDLYRARPGPLAPQQLSDGLTLADIACALLIDSAQDGLRSANGRGPEHLRLQHPEVHQATGMIIVQLNVTAAVALVRLRAYAYANDLRLRDVARDVVARRLRFYPDGRDGAG